MDIFGIDNAQIDIRNIFVYFILYLFYFYFCFTLYFFYKLINKRYNLNKLLNDSSCKLFSMFASVLMATAHIQSLPFSLSVTSHMHTSLSLFFSTSLQMTSHIHTSLPLLSISKMSINFSPTFKEGQESLSKVKNSVPLNHNLLDSSSSGLTSRETISSDFSLYQSI